MREKRRRNIKIHKIDFQDLDATFARKYFVTFDEAHSNQEERWRLLGLLREKVVVIFFRDDAEEVRIISARRAESDEEQLYFELCFGDPL